MCAVKSPEKVVFLKKLQIQKQGVNVKSTMLNRIHSKVPCQTARAPAVAPAAAAPEAGLLCDLLRFLLPRCLLPLFRC